MSSQRAPSCLAALNGGERRPRDAQQAPRWRGDATASIYRAATGVSASLWELFNLLTRSIQAYELSVLTGTQVLLLVVSETGLVYTFTTPKLQPLVTKAEGKNLIQVSHNAHDPLLRPDIALLATWAIVRSLGAPGRTRFSRVH